MRRIRKAIADWLEFLSLWIDPDSEIPPQEEDYGKISAEWIEQWNEQFREYEFLFQEFQKQSATLNFRLDEGGETFWKKMTRQELISILTFASLDIKNKDQSIQQLLEQIQELHQELEKMMNLLDFVEKAVPTDLATYIKTFREMPLDSPVRHFLPRPGQSFSQEIPYPEWERMDYQELLWIARIHYFELQQLRKAKEE